MSSWKVSRLTDWSFKVVSGVLGVTVLAFFKGFSQKTGSLAIPTNVSASHWDYFHSHQKTSINAWSTLLLPFLPRIRHCFGLSLCTILPLSVRPDVTGLPTHKPLLCIFHASFIPSLSCPPTAFVDSNLHWPSVGLCRVQAKTGRGNRRVSVEEGACHHVLAKQEKACDVIIHWVKLGFWQTRLSIN